MYLLRKKAAQNFGLLQLRNLKNYPKKKSDTRHKFAQSGHPDSKALQNLPQLGFFV
jgi:hypothetical protein